MDEKNNQETAVATEQQDAETVTVSKPVAETSSEEVETTDDGSEAATPAAQVTEDNEDQVEVERLKTQLAKAQKALKMQRLQEKEEKPVEEPQPSFDSDAIASLVNEAVEKKIIGLKKEMTRSAFETALAKTAQDQQEAERIRFYYENMIIPSGNLDEDIENARLLANKKRLQKQLAEVKASVQSKQSLGTGMGAGQKQSEVSSYHLSSEEKQLLKLSPHLTPEKIIASRKKTK